MLPRMRSENSRRQRWSISFLQEVDSSIYRVCSPNGRRMKGVDENTFREKRGSLFSYIAAVEGEGGDSTSKCGLLIVQNLYTVLFAHISPVYIYVQYCGNIGSTGTPLTPFSPSWDKNIDTESRNCWILEWFNLLSYNPLRDELKRPTHVTSNDICKEGLKCRSL